MPRVHTGASGHISSQSEEMGSSGGRQGPPTFLAKPQLNYLKKKNSKEKSKLREGEEKEGGEDYSSF